MHSKQLDLIKNYTTKTGEIRYMFTINLGLDPSTKKLKTTTRKGYKTMAEAETAFHRLTI